MEQSEGRLALKREKFKVELRRQQLDQLFQKRRQEFQSYTHTTPHQDQSILQEIDQLMTTLHPEQLSPIIRQVIDMDESLSLLFHITAVVPENVPAFFAKIIRNICGQRVLPEKVELQQIKENIEWLSFPKEKLGRIGSLFDQWSRTEGQTFSRVRSLLNQLSQISLGATTPVLEFVALLINIYLVVVWAEETALRESGTMDQKQSRRKHELDTCISILINMLAGEQQNILQQLPLILYSTGNNIKCFSIYFNLFLIRKVDPSLKVETLRVFIRILCLNHQELLEQHKEIICILANCMRTMPELPPQLQQDYLQIALKAKDMLSSLLSIINIRYQNTQLYLAPVAISNDDEDKVFIHHLAVILEKLSQDKYLCCAILQSKPMVSFLLAHLQPGEHIFELKTACCLVTLLNRATYNSLSFDVFSQQVLLTQKMLRIITKIDLSSNPTLLSNKYMLTYLIQLLGTFSNCCQRTEMFIFFLQQNLLPVVVSLYFKLPSGSRGQVREQCLFLYLNMLICSQNYLFDTPQQQQLILNLFFSNSKNISLFIESLKSSQVQIVQQAVQVLALFVKVEEKSAHNPHLDFFLSNSCLHQQIHLMEQSENQRIEHYGLRAKAMLSQRLKDSTQIDEQMVCL